MIIGVAISIVRPIQFTGGASLPPVTPPPMRQNKYSTHYSRHYG